MGWKSTIRIPKSRAISLIMERAYNASNEELEELLVAVGYGDNSNLTLFGHDFLVLDTIEEVNVCDNHEKY